jgi:hypothetical protein
MELAGNRRTGAAGSGTIEALTAHQALRAAAARTAALLRTAQDPDAAVPDLSWTVGETAAQLAEFTERDLSRLADMMVPAADDFITAAGRRRADDRIRAGGRKPWLGFTFGRLVTSP